MAVILGQNIDRGHYGFEHEFAQVKTPSHSATLQLIAYWRDCEARGGMRMGRDVPSREISRLLRDIMVTEPVGDWEDGRIRLAGFGMAEHFGRDVSGMLNSEVFAGRAEDCAMLLAGARNVIAKNRPGTVEHIVRNGEKLVVRQEMTCLPLQSPDGSSHWILIGTFNF